MFPILFECIIRIMNENPMHIQKTEEESDNNAHANSREKLTKMLRLEQNKVNGMESVHDFRLHMASCVTHEHSDCVCVHYASCCYWQLIPEHKP